MAEQLKIVIDADVVKALGGLDKLENHFKTTTNAAQTFGTTVTKGTQQATAALSKLPNTTNSANIALTNLGRVAQDSSFGFLGIANNLNPLLESFQRLKAETGSTKTALKALGSSLMGAGGLGLGLSVITAALQFSVLGLSAWTRGLGGASKKAKEAAEEIDNLGEVTKEIGKDVAQIEVLVAALNRENVSRKQKISVLKELQKIAPEYFNGLNAERATIGEINLAYQLYIANIRKSIEIKVKEKELNDIVSRRLKLQEQLNFKQSEEVIINGRRVRVFNALMDQTGEFADAQKELHNLLLREQLLIEQISKQKPLKIPVDNKVVNDLSKIQDEILSRARQFVKEFGDTFVVPDLEESFFRGKKDILPLAKKLLNDVTTGQLKVKIPVAIEFEPLPETFELTQSQIDNFFSAGKKTFEIPIGFKLDPTLLQGNIDKIDQKLNLRKKFEIFGDLGFDQFSKIDFTDINKGLAEGNRLFESMMQSATLLQGTLSQGLTSAFDSVFDSILEGKNVFQALGDALKQLVIETIKAVAKMLILKAITNLLFSGGGGAAGGAIAGLLGGIGGSANGGGFGLGGQIGSRSFGNVLNVVVTGQVSGQNILLAGQRAAGSNRRTG